MNKYIKSIVLITSLLCISKAWAYSDPIYCLAKNIYFEARGESLRGKLAVAKVTLNRVASGKFPGSICAVVYQPYQFSWTKHPRPEVRYNSQWYDSIRLAEYAIRTNIPELSHFNAMYFHNMTVQPKWRLQRVAKIGNHVFYN